jgi:hypothetical protein
MKRFLVVAKLGGWNIDFIQIIDAGSADEAKQECCKLQGLIPEARFKMKAYELKDVSDGGELYNGWQV